MESWKVYVLMGNKVVIDVYVNLEDAFEGAVENSVCITPHPPHSCPIELCTE